MINFTERYNSSIYRENHATVTADSEREVLRERLQISESTVKYKDEEIARYKNEVRHLHWSLRPGSKTFYAGKYVCLLTNQRLL